MIKRIKTLIKGLTVGFLAIALVLSFKSCIIQPELKYQTERRINDIVNSVTYSKTKITTSDDVVLFANGSFSDDRILKLSTYHIIGNKEDGIKQSVLAQYRKSVIVKNNKKHMLFEGDNNIKLTINSKLQKNAYNMLINHPKSSDEASLIVLNYKTGEVLTLVSTPSVEDGKKIKKGAFINKAMNVYTPGSVMKPITVSAVLESNPNAQKHFSYYCNGKNNYVKCTVQTHGKVDMYSALRKSCNCAITSFASRNIDTEELGKFLDKKGLLEKKQIEEIDCRQSGEYDPNAEPLWIYNGQGRTKLSPIAVAKLYGALANDGKLVTTHIFSDTKVNNKQLISKSTASKVVEATEGVIGVNELKLPVKAFAKTGTAQQGKGQKSHAWYVISLENDETPLTVLVFLQNGGSSVNAKDVAIDYINNFIL